jgi:UDP-glucose 4-epimerase
MKIMVTGGCGYIGSNLCNLLSKNHQIVCVDVDINQGFHLKSGIDIIQQDVTTLSSLWDSEYIFHLAAWPRIPTSFEKPKSVVHNNSQSTLQLLELARIHNVGITFVSSSSVYSDPLLNPYSYSKWIAEQHCMLYQKLYGMPIKICRLFNVYGNNHPRKPPKACVVGLFEEQKITRNVLTLCGTGKQKRDFTHVLDICEGLELTLELKNHKLIDLGHGQNYSVLEVAKMFQPKHIEFVPSRQGEGQDTLANLVETQKHIPWFPKRKLTDYVDDFLNSECSLVPK